MRWITSNSLSSRNLNGKGKMLAWYKLLVLIAWLSLHGVKSIQIRLVNGNKDSSYTSNYANNEPDSYSYNYDISDQGTGDQKTKWEKRENNVVRGAYSIVEPDGTTRLVEYTADQNGFRPVVTKLNTPSISPANSQSFYNNAAPYDARNPTYSSYANQNQRSPQIYGDRTGYVNPNAPFLSTGYNNDYYQRGRVAGYDDYGVSGAPYHLPLRSERQPVPLLHSAYHGYDNLYH